MLVTVLLLLQRRSRPLGQKAYGLGSRATMLGFRVEKFRFSGFGRLGFGGLGFGFWWSTGSQKPHETLTSQSPQGSLMLGAVRGQGVARDPLTLNPKP